MDLEGQSRRQGPQAATGEAMNEKIGPFIVPTADGGVALIYDLERIELTHAKAKQFWWTLNEYMNRRADEEIRKGHK